ncbi:Nucleotidyl transferase [Ignisphaera aggregans DSM 17230]|uniref:Nucleotidyl transferase n=1 Tax=Ignisphaera aggregans (strain DSM 17230 / JCM 13409 / AQ1.S1) TaxID=583356 RepID=E0SRX4_IGNAA|nr:Nucleotidyl transferase [Ignisphaera aggregans DSM 17230]
MEVVVLAGGKGLGMQKLTLGQSKLFVKIVGRPIVEWVLTNLYMAGLKRVVIVTDRPSLFEDITIRLGDKMMFDVRIQREEEIVGAIKEAGDAISKGALVVYGDTIVPYTAYRYILDVYRERRQPVLLVVPEEDVSRYGAIYMDSYGYIEKFIEKPKAVDTSYVFGGIAILNEGIVKLIESGKSLDESINSYIERGGRIYAAIWSDWWIDIDYPIDILKAIYYLLNDLREKRISGKAKIASTAVIEGPVVIEDNVEIDHYTVVKGPCYIGRNSFIGTHSFIRPYTDIEDGATIGSYTEISWSLISSRVTIGRGSFIGFSVIGEEAIIEPEVKTNLLIREYSEDVMAKAMKVKARGYEYLKAGSVIASRTRVPMGTILRPGEERL